MPQILREVADIMPKMLRAPSVVPRRLRCSPQNNNCVRVCCSLQSSSFIKITPPRFKIVLKILGFFIVCKKIICRLVWHHFYPSGHLPRRSVPVQDSHSGELSGWGLPSAHFRAPGFSPHNLS